MAGGLGRRAGRGGGRIGRGRIQVRSRAPQRALLAALLPASLGLAACERSRPEYEPPDRAAQIEQAAADYSPAIFDSITWPADSVRAFDGNVVYATYCRNCHGQLGEGGTEYAVGRGLEVPSIVEEGWAYDAEPDSVRRLVFVGHVEGMPTWGVAGITPREIDAVTHYLLEVLRPEMIGG